MSNTSPEWPSYPPPNPAPALDDEFLFSCLAEALQNDLHSTLNPLMIEELQKKENELLGDISSYLNDKIAEFSTFATHLVLNGRQEEAVEHSLEQALAQHRTSNGSQNDREESHSSAKDESPQSVQHTASTPTTTSASTNTTNTEPGAQSSPSVSSVETSSNTSLLGMPLKSSLAKPKLRKKTYGYNVSPPDPTDGTKKKKVMFSDKDQISIVPSLVDLEQEFSSDDEQSSEEEELAMEQTIGADPGELLPSYAMSQGLSDESDDDEFTSTVATPQQQFTAPVYSDSAYSGGMDSIDSSPDHTTTNSLPKIEEEKQSPLNKFSYPKPESQFHSYEVATSKSDQPSTNTNSLQSPLHNIPRNTTTADSPSDYNDADDDDDDVFQFDETLGVMPDAEANPPSTETPSLEFSNRKSAFRSQFSDPSYINRDISPSTIAGSLPTNQSRTSLNQLPTVVGSLRPKPMTKYKQHGPGGVNGNLGHHRLPAITGSNSSSLASSPSSNSTVDRNGNGLAHRTNGSQLSEARDNTSQFASSLPIRISSNNGWGHLARQDPDDSNAQTSPTHQQEAAPTTSSFVNNSSMLSSLGANNNAASTFLTDDFVGSVGKDFLVASTTPQPYKPLTSTATAQPSANQPNGDVSSELLPEDPLLEEDLALYHSPGSAARLTDPGLNPDQMSFSQRMMYERRAVKH